MMQPHGSDPLSRKPHITLLSAEGEPGYPADLLEGDNTAFYKHVDALEHTDGALRLYRRRGPWGPLRRQDVFHPAGEWWSVKLHKDGRCYVRLADPPRSA